MTSDFEELEREVGAMGDLVPDDFADHVMARVQSRKRMAAPVVRGLLVLVGLELLVLGWGSQAWQVLSTARTWAQRVMQVLGADVATRIGEAVESFAGSLGRAPVPTLPALWIAIGLLVVLTGFVAMLPGWHHARMDKRM